MFYKFGSGDFFYEKTELNRATDTLPEIPILIFVLDEKMLFPS